ncbi:hypothetical protein IV203_005652 [Nitzschia inconspicua]|uniref:Uncharacterized protein n=1 Tax=Nitzschia inconspicua TaxID=303405 RepID=A0A9K3KNT6_9STRA|nr:hypothetical protein IV203_005652 [Nitzschia inconspicua]
MSPKHDNGAWPPLDDERFDDQSSSNNNTNDNHPARPASPELLEDESASETSSQIIKDGNAVILKEFEATNISRQYSKIQSKRSKYSTEAASVLTLDGVDWSGFSGAAHHPAEGRPRSKKRSQNVGKDEILELCTNKDSRVYESTMRLVQRKLSLEVGGTKKPSSSSRQNSPGKYQSRRASLKCQLTPAPTSPVTVGNGGCTTSLNDARTASRPGASSRDKQSGGTSRSRRSGERLGGENSTHVVGIRSRRNTRNRAAAGEGEDGPNVEGTEGHHDDAVGVRPRRSSARRGESHGKVNSESPTRGSKNRVSRSERRLTSSGSSGSKPRKERSLSSSGVARTSRAPRSERKPRKHNSTGIIDSTRTAGRTSGRSMSPKDKARGKGLAAASATTLEVGTRPKSTRMRHGSNGGLNNVKEFAGNELIATGKGSLRW